MDHWEQLQAYADTYGPGRLNRWIAGHLRQVAKAKATRDRIKAEAEAYRKQERQERAA